MHELSVMKRVVEAVMSVHEQEPGGTIIAITLLVGEGRNFVEKWVQEYYDMLTADLPIANAKVKLETVPMTLKCEACGEIYRVSPHAVHGVSCPKCGDKAYEICTGYEMILKNIEYEIECEEEGNEYQSD